MLFPVLYPQGKHATPTQKLFRREPAITEFDKLFTPYHKSSDGFVRPTGSGLHEVLPSLHPAHGKLIPLRVVPLPYIRAIHARFHYASVGLPLRQRTKVHSPAHSSIGTPSQLAPLRLLVDVWFQIYFTPLSGVLFTFPSRYLFTIGLQEYLALGVSAPRFIRAIHVSNYSGTESRELHIFRIQDYYLLGSSFPTHFPIYTFCDSLQLNADPALQPRTYKYVRFGLFPFRSPLLRGSQEPSSWLQWHTYCYV